MINVPWTEAEDKTLRDGCANGYPFGQIAKILGHTRSSCIGRANRQGIKTPSVARIAKPVTARPAKPPAPRLVGHVGHIGQIKRPAFDVAPAEIVDATPKKWPKPIPPTAITFMDMKPDQCRMVLWDDATPPESRFYCGAPVKAPTSWCPACFVLVSDPRIIMKRAGR